MYILRFITSLLILLFSISQPTIQKPTSQQTDVSIQSATASAISSNTPCVAQGNLPDSSCTPGAIDPHVTQDNIDQTICVKGYTKTVRPSVSYTDHLKLEQIKQYGYIDTNPKDYEEDHLISLELGGSPTDTHNLWPELGASPNKKDSVENRCHEKVCAGQLSLTIAQHQIATNWASACE